MWQRPRHLPGKEGTRPGAESPAAALRPAPLPCGVVARGSPEPPGARHGCDRPACAGPVLRAQPCRAELSCAEPFYVMPSRAEPSPSMPCRAEPCHAMPCRAVLCRPVPYLSTAGQELQRPGARREPKRGMQLAAQGTVNKVLGASEKRQGPEQIQRRSSRGRGGRSHPGRSRSAPAGGGLASGGRADPSPESGGAGLGCPALPCPVLPSAGRGSRAHACLPAGRTLGLRRGAARAPARWLRHQGPAPSLAGHAGGGRGANSQGAAGCYQGAPPAAVPLGLKQRRAELWMPSGGDEALCIS